MISFHKQFTSQHVCFIFKETQRAEAPPTGEQSKPEGQTALKSSPVIIDLLTPTSTPQSSPPRVTSPAPEVEIESILAEAGVTDAIFVVSSNPLSLHSGIGWSTG